jgi:hypothetical protein
LASDAGKRPSLRVRVVLAVGLLLVVGTLILEMSGSAPRTAGSDHVSVPVFAAVVPGGSTLCQPVAPLPRDAERVTLLVGTYGLPLPRLTVSFSEAGGAPVAAGTLPGGGREGDVTVPLTREQAVIRRLATPSTTHAAGARSASACVRVGGSHQVAIGGEGGPIGETSEKVNGQAQGGRISLVYLRKGSESWWQLLRKLDERFGLGKAFFFGAWTLPVIALLALAAWIGTVRLLARELR